MSEPTWTERVEARQFEVPRAPDEDVVIAVVPVSLARDMAADAEVGRLLREYRFHIGRRVGFETGWEAATDDWSRFAYGPTPVAALQALAKAVKE